MTTRTELLRDLVIEATERICERSKKHHHNRWNIDPYGQLGIQFRTETNGPWLYFINSGSHTPIESAPLFARLWLARNYHDVLADAQSAMPLEDTLDHAIDLYRGALS